MNEELLRQWVAQHSAAVDATIAGVVIVVVIVRLLLWLRSKPLGASVAELSEALSKEPRAPGAEARPMTPRFKRNMIVGLLFAALCVIALGLSIAWSELPWLRSTTAPAQLISTHASHGGLEALYRVQPEGAPAFMATFSFVQRGSSWVGVDNEVRSIHVVDVLNNPLRYRIHERSSSKNPRGSDLVKTGLAIAGFFGLALLAAALRLAFS
ncbi:MAG TPA: hypothetical protein VNN08_13050 [Thermoanaerobaculia bacterium]|nr:hypothetical protein [Thermoanaerobaculia bacterium]